MAEMTIDVDDICDSAEKFLETLSPTHQLWRQSPTAWIFRGLPKSEWDLEARAARRGELAKYVEGDASTQPGRVEMMTRLLTVFQGKLERAGVTVPFASPKSGFSIRASTDEVQEDLLPLMALAQHHGLPTLLLDWTSRPRNAAYFAARDPVNRGAHIAVWAFRIDTISNYEPAARAVGIRHYLAPGSTNPNMQAQAGSFTLLTSREYTALNAYVAAAIGRTSTSPVLRRLKLRAEEAPKLLRLLSYEGVDGASMFPGADGVVRALAEYDLWDSKVGT